MTLSGIARDKCVPGSNLKKTKLHWRGFATVTTWAFIAIVRNRIPSPANLDVFLGMLSEHLATERRTE
jgi:hypothetical protein